MPDQSAEATLRYIVESGISQIELMNGPAESFAGAPQTMKLTTQQAADLLGVSRPTVVRLITDGMLPAERVGNRHRLLLDDVLAYREQRRNRQYETLAATAVDIDADDDPEVVRERLREARRVVAERRRAKTATR